jgi:hypothetical protein
LDGRTAASLPFGPPPEPCEPVVEVVRPAGKVPHYLPGTNPFVTEAAQRFKFPLEGARGGAATLYPEFRKRLKEILEGGAKN